jgi:Smg protein
MDMTFRILGPHERGRFAPEAWGHLLALKESGALSRAELEQVIERALAHLDGRIALDDLRALLDSVSYEDGTSVDSPTVH